MVNETTTVRSDDTDRNSPFRFSETRNKFTVIGCNTLGLIGNNNSGSEYQSGCFTYCATTTLSAQTDDNSCSGMGCCQTPIPKGMDFNVVALRVIKGDNTSQTWKGFGEQCSYAVLMETAAFSFRTQYITTREFSEMAAVRAPAVLDWSVRNETCEVAKRNLSGSYACLSANSRCADSTSGSAGYVCNCSQGYEGNPYLPDGCKDVDECNQGRPCPSDGVCHNTVGGYRCSCPIGRKYSHSNNTCVPDAGLIIGNSLSS